MNAPATAKELQAQMKALGKVVQAQKADDDIPWHRFAGWKADVLVTAFDVPDLRALLVFRRNELLRKSSHGRWHDGESREWSGIGHEQRMMVMLLAGIGGELDVLASRAWREFTPPERAAIKTEMRAAKRTFSNVAALCSRM